MQLKPLFVLCTALALSGCIKPNSSDTYSRSDMGRVATVMKGKVISIREVKITGTNSGVGAGAGAVAGGTAGSAIGSGGRANIIGAVGGAVVGGVIGAATEQALTEAGAQEFIVEQENGQTVAIVQTNEESLSIGDRVMILRGGNARLIRDTTK